MFLLPVKKRWRFCKIFVAFSEYMNFKVNILWEGHKIIKNISYFLSKHSVTSKQVWSFQKTWTLSNFRFFLLVRTCINVKSNECLSLFKVNIRKKCLQTCLYVSPVFGWTKILKKNAKIAIIVPKHQHKLTTQRGNSLYTYK